MSAAAAERSETGEREGKAHPFRYRALGEFLAGTAERDPHRPAFADQEGRDAWCGRPRIELTYGIAAEMVARLAGCFANLGLPPGAIVAVCLPNGTEACLTLLALERAGLTPCLLSPAWSESELGEAIEAANASAAVAQSVVGDLRPAETLCRIAARYFGLRFVCAFGPQIPDGVIDLDRALIEGAEPPQDASEAAPVDQRGFVTFSRRSGMRPMFRTSRSLIASALAYLVAARIEPGERMIGLIAPDDHVGLATGFVAALVGGASYECLGLFDGNGLRRALERDGVPTHLVAPGWLEPALARARLPENLRTVTLVHRAPVRFKARTALQRACVDVLSFDEIALIAKARDSRGQFALALEDDAGPASPSRGLLKVRRDGDGAILFGGPAAEVREIERGQRAAAPEWRDSGFRVDLFAGIVIGVADS